MKTNQPPDDSPWRAAITAAPLLELAGVKYRVVREADLAELARRSRVGLKFNTSEPHSPIEADPLASIGPRLRERRRQRGWTQAQVADRAGVRVETVNRIEKGRNTPDYATIRKLAGAMREADTPGRSPRGSARPRQPTKRSQA